MYYFAAAASGAALLKLLELFQRRTVRLKDWDSSVAKPLNTGLIEESAVPRPLRRRTTKSSLLQSHAEVGSTNGVIVIGIAGGSASGKSYYCKRLFEVCNDVCWCAVLGHDMYYKDEWQVKEECDGDWDCPEALHTDELVTHIDKLLARESVEAPHYDFTR